LYSGDPEERPSGKLWGGVTKKKSPTSPGKKLVPLGQTVLFPPKGKNPTTVLTTRGRQDPLLSAAPGMTLLFQRLGGTNLPPHKKGEGGKKGKGTPTMSTARKRRERRCR